MSKRDNIKSWAPISRFRGNQLAALDKLPPLLRRALWEGVIDWDARETRWQLNQMLKMGVPLATAVKDLAKAIRGSDQFEVTNFAAHWPSRFGRYPHMAAKATLQRYGGWR